MQRTIISTAFAFALMAGGGSAAASDKINSSETASLPDLHGPNGPMGNIGEDGSTRRSIQTTKAANGQIVVTVTTFSSFGTPTSISIINFDPPSGKTSITTVTPDSAAWSHVQNSISGNGSRGDGGYSM